MSQKPSFTRRTPPGPPVRQNARAKARLRLCWPRALLLVLIASSEVAQAQWVNRYPKLAEFGHHVYLEQHELPILAHGPTDPAPAPDGRRLALASQGWIWILDLDTGVARRLTSTAAVDSRPRWSPDGMQLAFVRDSGRDTAIVVRDLQSGRETLINTPTIELDPEFSAAGDYLYYTSGVGDVLSLWRRHLASGVDEQLTDLPQIERNARRLADNSGVLYRHSARATHSLRLRDFVAGTDEVVHSETLTYHFTADTHPSQRLIVYSAPIDNAYHLWTMDLDAPQVKHRLTEGAPYAVTPAFSADGDTVFFSDSTATRQFRLMRIPTHGGTVEAVSINSWDYGVATGTARVVIADARGAPLAARVSMADKNGHPVAFAEDATYFDSQTGRYFFYIDGAAEFTLPVGDYTLLVARGPMTPVVTSTLKVRAKSPAEARISLSPLWDADAAGYVSADHHVHLNGDGHHRARHEHALRVIRGEDLNLLAPMSWNRWERRIDAPLLGTDTQQGAYIVSQGQEVRSHFHGHIGLTQVKTPFAPWFFGPRNPTLGNPDLTNGDVLSFADKTGAFATYVHPIDDDAGPFAGEKIGYIPLELVSDAVLAERMGLEMVCAWTSPLGNAQLWYRLLNIGKPIAAMSGTDAWVDFHRTPAVGTGRNYLRLDGAPISAASILEAAIAGRGFVTTGPALEFSVGDNRKPGDVTPSGKTRWQARLASTVAVDTFEIIVNGVPVAQLPGVGAGETRDFAGEVELPGGGWIAARAYASETTEDSWPSMHLRAFAHSSPIWINAIGSVEPLARRQAAADLLRAIDASQAAGREAYGEREMARMNGRFEQARSRLKEMSE